MKKIKIYELLIIVLLMFVLQETKAALDYQIEVATLDNPSPGYLFLSPLALDSLVVLDNTGNTVLIKPFKMPSPPSSDLQYSNIELHPNGMLSVLLIRDIVFYVFDKNLKLIDSVKALNGYDTDPHEFRILSNGNYLLIATRQIKYDLSKVVVGGYANAIIIDNIIQEIDKNKRVVFEWIASEHYYPGDESDSTELFNMTVDPFHINSVEETSDGNFLISTNHFDEITKINRKTGEIMWRLGGSKCKNNQFTFVADSVDNFVGFSHQHDVRCLPNGNITLFDNGNLKDTQYSRGVEYQIDANNKIAKKVWEYRTSPDTYASYMGSVQRLPNGNTLIGWGGNTQFSGDYDDEFYLTCTEVRDDGTKAFEMKMKNNQSYRALRYVYLMSAVTKDINKTGSYTFNENEENKTALTLNIDNLSGQGKLTTELHYCAPQNATYTDIKPCGIFAYRWVVSKEGVNSASGTLKFDVSSLPKLYSPESISVYHRDSEGSGSYKYVTTKYNSTTKEIEVTGSCLGEFILCINEMIMPTLQQPPDNSNNMPNKFVATWLTNNSSNNYYRIELSDNTSFNKPIIEEVLYDTDNYEFSNLSYNKDYYWRVKVQNTNCESRWTDVSHFRTTLRPPTLDLPASSSYDNPINGTISWYNVEGASKYNVQISGNMNFDSSAIIINRNVTGLLYLQYSNLEYNKDYYWRVRAVNDIAQSEWSNTSKFTTIIPSPENVFPQNNALGIPANGIITWKKVPTAELYKIEIDTTLDFVKPFISESGITTDTFNYTGLRNNFIYYWRVKAVNRNSKSDWSVTSKFTTIHPPPVLSVPQNNAIKIPVNGTIIWKQVLGATKYRIQISSTPDFVSPKYDVPGNTQNIFHYENLEENIKYFWRVNASNDNGTSEWSEVWTFFTKLKSILSTPVLVSPTDYYIRLSGNEKLIWDPVHEASNYWLQISTNPEFSELIVNDEKLINTNFPIHNLQYDTKYYWRVAASNSETTSDWSETWTFMTIIAMPSLVSPANNSVNIPITGLLNWNKVEGTFTYKVQLSEDNKFNTLVFEKDNIYDLFIDYPQLSSNKEYWWRVSAKNANSESDWSEVFNFKTHDPTGVNDNHNSKEIVNITNYPNPCTDETFFEFKLMDPENISITIYDELGNEKSVVFSGFLNAGVYNMHWFTKELSNGAYFYSFKHGNKIEIKEILIIK